MNRKNDRLITENRSDESGFPDLDVDRIPRHIGIIMDGNGRWAQRRGLPRTAGHRVGIENVRRIAKAALEVGIDALTLYTFSTENWQRPRQEVDFLMRYCEDFIQREMAELHQKNIKVQFLGRRQPIPESLLRVIDQSVQLTQHNTGLILNFALNYGGRVEIIDATRKVIAACRQGLLSPDELDEEVFARYLYTAGLPDAELIIRTAGEQRTSNFLIWQAVGASFWTTPVFWPDFQKEHLLEAIEFWRSVKRDAEVIP